MNSPKLERRASEISQESAGETKNNEENEPINKYVPAPKNITNTKNKNFLSINRLSIKQQFVCQTHYGIR